MTNRRSNARQTARRVRALAKDEAAQKTALAHVRVLNAVRMARVIIVDPSFADTLRSQGVQSVPQALMMQTIPDRPGSDLEATRDHPSGPSLEFVIAWTFFYPLLANPVIAAHLHHMWPSFTVELKDAFIALVMHGGSALAGYGSTGRPVRESWAIFPDLEKVSGSY